MVFILRECSNRRMACHNTLHSPGEERSLVHTLAREYTSLHFISLSLSPSICLSRSLSLSLSLVTTDLFQRKSQSVDARPKLQRNLPATCQSRGPPLPASVLPCRDVYTAARGRASCPGRGSHGDHSSAGAASLKSVCVRLRP